MTTPNSEVRAGSAVFERFETFRRPTMKPLRSGETRATYDMLTALGGPDRPMLRFWRDGRDRLFLFFSGAFASSSFFGGAFASASAFSAAAAPANVVFLRKLLRETVLAVMSSSQDCLLLCRKRRIGKA